MNTNNINTYRLTSTGEALQRQLQRQKPATSTTTIATTIATMAPPPPASTTIGTTEYADQQLQRRHANSNNNNHACGPVKLDQHGRPEQQQITKLTKWLCAIIFVLVLVVLALVLLDGPIVSLRTSRANKFLEQISQSLSANGGQQTSEAGRLLAASSDDHFMSSMPSTDSLDDNDHTDQTDSDDNSGGHDSVNQIPLPHRTRPRLTNHQHGSRTTTNKLRDPDAICMSPGCVRAAAQILNNMDNQTRPCDDFYQFACGRWIQTQVIPDEKTSLSVFSQNTADLNIKLRALIERAPRDEDPPIVGQMRNMYASCMNLSDIEARGDEPLLDVLRDLGGWPVLTSSASLGSLMSKREASSSGSSSSNTNRQQQQQLVRRTRQGQTARRTQRSRLERRQSSSDDGGDESTPPDAPTTVSTTSANTKQANWLDIIIKFRQRGFSHDMIIDLSVVPDVRNSRRYIIELDQSSLGLPDRSYYFKGMNDTTVAAYYNLMVESAVMLGASRMEARRQMLEALEFETSLAKISMPREQRRNVTRLYNKMVARDLYKLAPNIDWQRYLKSLLKDDQLDLGQDEVIVKAPNFIKQIDLLLQTTEPRIVANYMIWRIVRHSMGGLSRRWRELSHSYSTVTTGRQVEEPRWEQCLGSIDGTLGTALSAFYVKNHFNERSKAAALEMVEYIREEFLRILDEIDWMDEETRDEARLKARAIATYIGYPEELLQDELVEELYSGVKMARTNFYQNVRSLRIWSTDYAFGQLRKPNKRGDWKKHARAAVVNAYYNSLENSIEFPAGILQGAFFDSERPNYMNFGAIGYVIGHEITHGFDDRGRQFDKDGNDRNWWKPKTDARFKERAQCIIDQYGNFSLPEQNLRVNGVITQGENIADNGGIKEAYRAYRRWTKDHGREARLPGLEYSADQLFWISAANIWCGKFRPEVLKLRINSGVHSPAKFRVVGPLSNSPEFAQSFNCPAGSPMNPHKKCSVW
uniref:Membrane metallo-endopeptidase-like 1 n=1 Tax=Aceria tosichella TaxID=561515 RepID=A0A6G1SPT9_9ACAR